MILYELKPELKKIGVHGWALTSSHSEHFHHFYTEKSEAVNSAVRHCRRYKYGNGDGIIELKVYYACGVKLHKHIRFEVGKRDVHLSVLKNKQIWGAWFSN